MTRMLYPLLLVFSFLSHPCLAAADESKELRQQRLEAQRDRQQQVNERNREVNDAHRVFRDFTRDLRTDYQAQLRDLDTEFELRRVELKAEHDVRVAGAEADYQRSLSGLFMNPGAEFTDQAVQQLQADAKAFADTLFKLKRQAAEELHGEQIANEERKNALLTERDRRALDEAASLGLTQKYAPILAVPIGEGLTPQEERWNERQRKEVVKLEERNRKTLGEFRNGDKLRKWEIRNLNEDFKLTWDEKAELHGLDSEQIFYNSLFMQPTQGAQIDRQKIMTQLTEANEKKRLINIEYRKIKDKNRITRREERQAILAE